MLQAYKVYIQPIIQYGVLIYGTTNISNLMPLERVQKLVWRIIFGIRKYDSINAIRQKHQLLNECTAIQHLTINKSYLEIANEMPL